MNYTLDMMNEELKKLEHEVISISYIVDPLLEKQNIIRSKIAKLKSKMFIKLFNIKKVDVQMSNDEDVPWVCDLLSFITWMRGVNCHKRCAEWNGRIYWLSDLFAGRMPDTNGWVDDLED
jgi:hypothetical protein